MSGHTGPKLLAVMCILTGALTASHAGTQTAAPPAAQSTLPGSPPAGAAETTKDTGCNNTDRRPASAGGASIVQATGESLQHKRWQATGGEIQFTVKSYNPIPSDASVVVCFRWKTDPESKSDFISTRPSRLDLESDRKLLKVTTTLPDLGPLPSNVKKALPLVPLAEVRILAIDNEKRKPAVADKPVADKPVADKPAADKPAANKAAADKAAADKAAADKAAADKAAADKAAADKAAAEKAAAEKAAAEKAAAAEKPAADVITTIGITHPVWALAFAIATVLLGLWVLHIAARRRLKDCPGIQKANWLLRIISTPSGFASLSQLQIVLWTFVVAASAVYVMSLSGQLIEITAGTLVLLGIAGAAGIGAKAHNETQAATAEAKAAKAAADKAAADIVAAQKAAAKTAAPTDLVAIAADDQATKSAADTAKIANATKDRADALKKPPATQVPKWSDLIVSESVKDDGTKTREIDVARFQMLLFTLVTAVFVLMTVVTSYVIPEISVGFQTLMGISNGVYLGSKIAQGS